MHLLFPNMAGNNTRLVFGLLFILGGLFVTSNCAINHDNDEISETDVDHVNDVEEPTLLHVYVVPHSHMDVGWVYTVDESMHAYAANVYTTVVAELARNPSRRFIAVEQEFFRLWWNGVATDDQKGQTRKLVANGQLEFIIGGQVMHDEAVTELSAIIQQMTEGHAFIYETFGVRPRFSWHVDPFGASAATPTLFALMGFNAHLTSRIDYNKKADMMRNKGLQFVWQASPSLGSAQSIFTHVMDTYSYCVPMEIPPFSNRSAFMWNGVAKFPDPPSDGIYPNMSDPVTRQNIAQYADFMAANIRQRAEWFKSPHLLWPWGCDKQFFNATDQFKNMDLLQEYINQQRAKYGLKIRYATVGEFFTALHNIQNMTWTVKTKRDFLPYSTARTEAWTGFYTSRIELKGLARASQSLLRAGETLFTVYTHLYNVTRSLDTTAALEQLSALRWATAEVQHHDGVTGTEAPKVRDMYINHLNSGNTATQGVITNILAELCPINDSLRTEGAKKQDTIAVYNSLGWTVRRAVRVEVDSPNITVLNGTGQSVIHQVNPPTRPGGSYVLYFFATLPPVGYETFIILYFDDAPPIDHSRRGTVRRYDTATDKRRTGDSRTGSHGHKVASDVRDEVDNGDDISIENACFRVAFDSSTKLLSSITDKRTGTTTSMSSKLMEYSVYHDVLYGQPSNNYVFRPYTAASGIDSFRVTIDVTTGNVVNETTQQFYGLFDDESRYSVTTRLVDNPSGQSDPISCGHIELEFKVGPLSMNKELVFRLSTHMKTAGNLYADVNAFQTMNRSRDPTASRAQNVFPMVSCAYIEDTASNSRLMLLSDRSHGVSSPQDGDIEVFLHRRLVNNEFEDHNYNLTLTEPSVATSTFRLLLGNATTTAEFRHRSWLQLENPPVVALIGRGLRHPNLDGVTVSRSRRLNSALSNDLPPNVHLLTFKTPGWNFNDSKKGNPNEAPSSAPNLDRILMRLQHLYEVGEHPKWSKPVTLDLQKIISPLGNIKVAEERSLTAIWNITEMTRWKWKTEESNGSNKLSDDEAQQKRTPEASDAPSIPEEPTTSRPPKPSTGDTFKVTLNPQEIKTFFITLQKPTA